MSISMLESLVSTAERRALLNKEKQTTARLADFMGIIPAITGKVELVYEGEQEGAAFVAEQLIGQAIKTFLPGMFPKIEKLSKKIEESPYSNLLEAVFSDGGIVLYDESTDKDYQSTLDELKPLKALVSKYQPETLAEDRYFVSEFVLWALAEYHKLGKERLQDGFQFKDLLGIL
ncbi:MAG: magnesium chelatase, partial [Aquirufa sp.]